jgi:hypothetical protein
MLEELKPDKNIEVPPYNVLQGEWGCYNHTFIWQTTEMGNYQQQICKKCGVTGQTKKNN